MKHIESGRTMVEMLGVLAIIGVISAGGLYGYNVAMKRLRANELLNEANTQAVLVASALMSNPNPENPPSIDAPTSPYGTFGNSFELDGDKFKLMVSDLDKDTCELMKSLAGGPIRRLECDSEEGKDTFTAEMYFNKDLSTSENPSEEESEPTACEILECVHGSWNDAECKCDCDENWHGKICDSDCDGIKSQELNTCLHCNSHITREMLLSLNIEASECHRCDNYFMGYLFGHRRCLDCGRHSEVDSEEECKRCDDMKAFVYEGKIYCGEKDCGTGFTQAPNGQCQSL